MKLIYIYLAFLINYIKSANYEYEINITSLINEGFRFFSTFRIESGRYLYYTDSCLQIKYPERDFSDFYLIFDYNIHRNTFGDDFNIKIFDKTYYGRRNKIILKIKTTKAFTIFVNFEEYSNRYELYFNFITKYSDYPYLLYYYEPLSINLTGHYCVNDEFRMIVNITDNPLGKKYYFYQSFKFKDKPLYKLFETYDSALDFNFKDFDGNLDIDDNQVMKFKRSNKKYNYLALYFKGKETYDTYYEYSEFFFTNIDNYEQFIFNPIIPIIIFLITIMLITALFYYLFQFEKKPKKSKEKEGDKTKELIPI